MENSRMGFMKNSFAGTVLAVAGGILPGFSAVSYNRIIGSNEKIRVAMMGVNSRGAALAHQLSFLSTKQE